MTIRLLLLFIFLSVGVSVILDPLRRSCGKKKILIESENIEVKMINWTLPKDKESILQELCIKSVQNIRVPRHLREKLPRGMIFRGFRKTDDESILNNPERFNESIFNLLRNGEADQLILNEFHKILIRNEYLNNHLEPDIILTNRVPYTRCVEREIQMKIQVMKPDELKIWRCEDIGIVKSGSYEFYNLPSVWMVEDEDNKIFKINLNNCPTNSRNQLFCPINQKTYFTSTCSVNNTDSCQKTRILPKKNNASYSRILPDGIAIYGTFKKQSNMKGTKNSPQGISPGLYYYNQEMYKDPKSLSEKAI